MTTGVDGGPGREAGPLNHGIKERSNQDRARSLRARGLSISVVVLVVLGTIFSIFAALGSEFNFIGWFCLALPLGMLALIYARRAEERVVDVDGPAADEQRSRQARRLAVTGITLASIYTFVLLVWSSWSGFVDVANTFFSWENISSSFPLVLEGFKLNIAVFIVAEFCVLIWALVIVVMRQLPGRAAAPLRWLAIIYVDVFRGLPAIVTIYLVVFGLPLTDLPIISDIENVNFVVWGIQIDQLFILGVIALTLVYGAYVAEVYRSGIESVHWSQSAAARGLGLSEGQTLRHVVMPQAVRRVIPPLMNDFIGLQKDTALLNVAGVLEGFNVARIYAGNNFNLSSVMGLGICFLVITIPMTRLTDYLVKRDQNRMQANS